jgi:hypothetical protein
MKWAQGPQEDVALNVTWATDAAPSPCRSCSINSDKISLKRVVLAQSVRSFSSRRPVLDTGVSCPAVLHISVLGCSAAEHYVRACRTGSNKLFVLMCCFCYQAGDHQAPNITSYKAAQTCLATPWLNMPYAIICSPSHHDLAVAPVTKCDIHEGSLTAHQFDAASKCSSACSTVKPYRCCPCCCHCAPACCAASTACICCNCCSWFAVGT